MTFFGIYADEETGIDGTLWAGGMERAGSEDEEDGNEGHYAS